MKRRSLLAVSAAVAAAPSFGQPVCRAESGARVPLVVELFTSEGCSSCPPADRWLSALKGRDDVIALGFHVTYWDRLGWPDRFASSEFTARQYEHMRRLGADHVYTPQVVVDGRDWRGWRGSGLPAAAAPRAAPRLVLERDGDAVLATVAPWPGAAARGDQVTGFWAVTEDGHENRVRAGENAGETLRHDHVVRLVRPLADWRASDGLRSRLEVGRGEPKHPRRVVFVVADPATRRPLQALALAC
jgi:hypothetical protein